MCTVVHDVYIVFYHTVYTVSVYSAIFTLHAPSLQGKFLIVCISVYALRYTSLEGALTHSVQIFTSNLLFWIWVVLCFFLFCFFFSQQKWIIINGKKTKFLGTYIWHARNAVVQRGLPPCIRTGYTIIQTKNARSSFTWAMSRSETRIYFTAEDCTTGHPAIDAN